MGGSVVRKGSLTDILRVSRGCEAGAAETLRFYDAGKAGACPHTCPLDPKTLRGRAWEFEGPHPHVGLGNPAGRKVSKVIDLFAANRFPNGLKQQPR